MSKNFKDIRFKVKNSNSFIPQIWRIFILDILYDFLTKNKIVGSRSPIIVKYHQYFKTEIHSTKTIYMLKVSTFPYINIHIYQNIFQILRKKIENKLYFMHCKNICKRPPIYRDLLKNFVLELEFVNIYTFSISVSRKFTVNFL